jgi:hypothetical protein
MLYRDTIFIYIHTYRGTLHTCWAKVADGVGLCREQILYITPIEKNSIHIGGEQNWQMVCRPPCCVGSWCRLRLLRGYTYMYVYIYNFPLHICTLILTYILHTHTHTHTHAQALTPMVAGLSGASVPLHILRDTCRVVVSPSTPFSLGSDSVIMAPRACYCVTKHVLAPARFF